MNTDIQCSKKSKKDKINTDFILVCLAFVAGVLIFRLSGNNVFSIVEELAFVVFALGCIFLLLLLLLAAASSLGKLLIPLYSLMCGYCISAFSGFIIQLFSGDTPLVIPLILFASAYIYIFAFLFSADSARRSSALVARRTFSDVKLRAGFARTAAAILTVSLLITVLFAFLSKYIFDTF